jgi:hypothetical protein
MQDIQAGGPGLHARSEERSTCAKPLTSTGMMNVVAFAPKLSVQGRCPEVAPESV